MEAFIVLLLIAILIITLNKNSNLTQNLQRIESEITSLRNQLLKFTASPKEISIQEEKKIEVSKPYESIFKVEEPPLANEAIASPEVVEENINILQPKEIISTVQVGNPIVSTPKVQVKVPEPTFFERHPDMEKFIGENLVSKIGIAILVLAIGFFVKYAIDQNWIGPVARVAIGILCGAILVGVAHKLRNSYRGFSSVLAGGGIAVFYFSITLGFQQFHLFSQTVAFIIMLIITAFAVALSLLYNKQELAVIALLGGFIAPFLVSTGNGNYKVLFGYLIILNSGLLVLAYNKAWRILNLLSFIFTVLLFGTWLSFLNYDEPVATYKNAFAFAIVFYLLFFAINIAHNIKEKKKFIASDFGILLSNTALFFGAGIICINNMRAGEFRGLFSASMGVFNLIASYFLFRKQKVDSNILYLLIGITLTFISITAPLQMHGNYITLFWASEAVLLYWLFIKSKIKIIQYSAIIIWALMIGSLFMDWVQLYLFNNSPLAIIFNKGFITTVFCAIATYCLYILRNAEADKTTTVKINNNIFRISAIILLYAAGAFEINYQVNTGFDLNNISALYLLLYTISFVSIFTLVTQKVEVLHLKFSLITALFSSCIILYLISIATTFQIQKDILIQNIYGKHFIAHWLVAIITSTVIFRLIQLLRSNQEKLKGNFSFISAAMCTVVVIYLSVEVHLISNAIFYSSTNPLENIQTVYIKTGLPILWGFCSFAFMWLGMHYKFRALRIISLSLFTITLVKLFVFDIKNIPAGGKIAAFFCLGILLLVVSFMYQRLKKIIIDNEEKVG